MDKKKFLFWSCLICACVFIACLPVRYDFDLFARLIVGEQFLEHFVLPFRDFLSYTPTHPWFDHEWGSGVIFYLILKYLGSFGFVLFYALILFGITFFILKIQKLQKHPIPPSLIFITAFLTLFYIGNPSLIRCQLITFFLFTVFLYILEKNRKKETRLIWLIPLITVFWNNVHGGIVSGLGLIFIYMIGAILEKKTWKKYLIIFILSFGALIINPYGTKYLKFLFSAATMNRKFVVEWWPFYRAPHSFFSGLICIGAYFVSILNIIKTRNKNITKFLVLTITLAEGLIHIKLIPLALIAFSALSYNDICTCFRKQKNILKNIEKCLYASIFISALFFVPLLNPFIPRVNFNFLPYKETEFIKTNNISGNILVPFALGSYVSYKLYPNNLIYMDGRYEEVYNNKEFNIMGDFELADTNHWDRILKEYDTQIIMIRKQIPAYTKMLKKPDWKLVYNGNLCGVFLRYDKLKSEYKQPPKDISYYRDTAFDGSFGTKIK